MIIITDETQESRESQGVPAFNPTTEDGLAFLGTLVMLLAMLGLIAILQ